MFFSLLKRIAATERPFEVGVPSVFWGEGGSEEKLFWRYLVRKYVPNASSWELLVWSGVIWGRFGVILVILECRIRFVRFDNVYLPVGLYTFCILCISNSGTSHLSVMQERWNRAKIFIYLKFVEHMRDHEKITLSQNVNRKLRAAENSLSPRNHLKLAAGIIYLCFLPPPPCTR